MFQLKMRIKVPNVANNRSTYGFVILSEGSESKDLLRSPGSTVKSPGRSFDCALRAPLRMTYVSVIPAFTLFGLLIHIVNWAVSPIPQPAADTFFKKSPALALGRVP